jgi:hypothetical protein
MLQNHPGSGPGKWFWLAFCGLGIPLNVLASRDYLTHGVVHLNLHPYVALVPVLILRHRRAFPRFAGILLSAVFILESAIVSGSWIALQARTAPVAITGNGEVHVFGVIDVHRKWLSNYIFKLQTGAVYLSDHLQDSRIPFLLLCSLASIALLVVLKKCAARGEPGPL